MIEQKVCPPALPFPLENTTVSQIAPSPRHRLIPKLNPCKLLLYCNIQPVLLLGCLQVLNLPHALPQEHWQRPLSLGHRPPRVCRRPLGGHPIGGVPGLARL